MTKVLLVEDDLDLGNLLKQYLQLNQFEVTRVMDGLEARKALQNEDFSIAILDVMMPNEDGFTLAQKLSQTHPNLPFLFVTARNLKEDVIQGLKLGADDYITKPFDADELILRIKNILKRQKALPETKLDIIHVGNYQLDGKNLILQYQNNVKKLTEKEAKLLEFLHQNRNQLIKRETILNYLWDEADFFSGRSLDVFMSRLRKYLADDPQLQIESIRGVGFRFSVNY